MDTKPLERFAAQARRDLLAAVEAQTSAVLAAGSVARSEHAETVKRLEVEIAGHGRKHVIDKVAYTWFNSLIALRYMDVHGYTSTGVVSPAQGHEHGQPEILADAKGGHLDTDVITPRAQQAIMGLLDGTRRSTDAEGEAYALLLTEYCRHWNKTMPFMFEREGDYTELLVPAGLLADGGILSRARALLTKDVCEDVEVIGWLYQFYVSERKQEIFDSGVKRGAAEIPAATQLFTPHWIVRYLVENSLGRLWMLNRPESHIIDRMDYYIPPVDEETDFLKISGPEDLTVIDPACGSGHMLTYAFDLLYAIYEEEGYAPSEIPSLVLNHNLHGTEIDPRAGSLAAFALAMKARAKDRRYFAREVEPKICVIEPISFGADELDFLAGKDGDRHAEEAFWNQFRDADTLGSLISPESHDVTIGHAHLESLSKLFNLANADSLHRAQCVIDQARYLAARYAVLVANPPYLSAGNANADLSKALKTRFLGFHGDLFSAFIARASGFVVNGGRVGMMTPNVWLYIATHLASRHMMADALPLRSLVELPLGGFKGATVQVCAFVCSVQTRGLSAQFVRLAKEPAHEDDLRTSLIHILKARNGDARYFERDLGKFQGLPNSAFAYWLSDSMLGSFKMGRTIAAIAEPRVGLQTNDNGRFIRHWHEVSVGKIGGSLSRAEAAASSFKWFPYNKGGDFRKWYGNQDFVVNWEHDGAEIIRLAASKYGSATRTVKNLRYYFLPAISWSKIGTGLPAFRYFPPGFIFDHAGTSAFGKHADLLKLAAICNSNVAREMLAATSPTLNLEVGTLAQLPIIDISERGSDLAAELIDIHREDWNASELAREFRVLGFVAAGTPSVDLAVGEAQRAGESQAEYARHLELELNAEVARLYGIDAEIDVAIPLSRVTLNSNPAFKYGAGLNDTEVARRFAEERTVELVSYAVGCMFGRYSLDEPGLILADQGATLQDYLAKMPSPKFMPDADNVIPIVDDSWFEDDIVERFRQFLRTAFGVEHFEENMRFMEKSLGVKTIRDYFIAKSNPSAKTPAKSRFYEDHIQRYRKRPIYWMFSSAKGSFNALIYMHRYTPSTVSTVLNEYLREYRAKLEVALQRTEEAAAGGASAKEQKEADRLRKVLAELRDYEHDVLYPLDIQKTDIDLDDGVLVNYLRLGPALRDFGLEKDRTKVESWTWPNNLLEPRK